MKMTPRTRKVALTAHIATSVGWLGGVACFLALSIGGLVSDDADLARGAYLAMNVIGEYVLVPLSIAALVSGLVQSLGTDWGLFRYRWVVTKLLLTCAATALLMLHQFTTIAAAAARVKEVPRGTVPQLGGLSTQLVVDASLAALVLLAIVGLSVLKPWGQTAFGQSRSEALTTASSALTSFASNSSRGGLRIVAGAVLLLIAIVIALHVAGGGFGSHLR